MLNLSRKSKADLVSDLTLILEQLNIFTQIIQVINIKNIHF